MRRTRGVRWSPSRPSRPRTTAARSAPASRRRAEVEDRVRQRRRAAEALALAHEHVGGRRVRDGEPQPVRPHEHLLEAARLAGRDSAAAAAASAACRARARGRPRPGSRSARGARAPRGSSCGISYAARYAHICSAHVATSRARVRGSATHSATGAAAAAASTAGCGRRIRRRTSGAATPAATIAHAAARMALDFRKARGVYEGRLSHRPLGARDCLRRTRALESGA